VEQSNIIALFIFAVAVAIYLTPSFVASARNHQNMTPILILNLFLGWTFLGWVAALVWAFTKVDKKEN